jgi:hypothetical protein
VIRAIIGSSIVLTVVNVVFFVVFPVVNGIGNILVAQGGGLTVGTLTVGSYVSGIWNDLMLLVDVMYVAVIIYLVARAHRDEPDVGVFSV